MIGYRWELRHTVASAVLLVVLATSGRAHVETAADVLPSWNDGPARHAIVAFVTAATQQGGAGFIPPEARIAVFDMDGTLMTERPAPGAVLPVVADVRAAVAKHPELGNEPAVAALLKGDLHGVLAQGESGLAQVVAAAIDGRDADQVAAAMASEERALPNARYHVPYTRLAYRPMVELLRYLEANGFQTWICSGSPIAYTRGMSREIFGIPPERVMGSALQTRLEERDGKVVLAYTGKVEHVTDREGKPPVINLALGRHPVFVAGNVGGVGDVAMMRYAMDRGGPSFALLINHDDAGREFAYAEKGGESLAAAARYHFQVVSMKNDWQTVFDPAIKVPAPPPEPANVANVAP
ncbi:HAD family hydrolase [Luteibacter aegosomatissinici]|uniref:HAD family hydrolase n=1 Tax=Luteibacter aegosomatissinici TaxID=2911539 RepID=UPI001FF89728|nr:haloacid dehalogenase-like hydrolase [Luteibacter aegosomatissinici]UPG95552.1 haloacid dehalogenase-like hydrolase [Luteibacter aegosomatissinici]